MALARDNLTSYIHTIHTHHDRLQVLLDGIRPRKIRRPNIKEMAVLAPGSPLVTHGTILHRGDSAMVPNVEFRVLETFRLDSIPDSEEPKAQTISKTIQVLIL